MARKKTADSKIRAGIEAKRKAVSPRPSGKRKNTAVPRDEEARFLAFAGQSRDVIYFTDERGVITYLSPAFKDMFGFAPEEGLGRNFSDFLAPESVDKALSAFRTAVETGTPSQRLELAMRRKDGSVFLGELNGTLFLTAGRPGAAGIIRDISERGRAQKTLARQLTIIEAIREAQELYIEGREEKEIFQRLLEILLSITGSEIGYIEDIRPGPGGDSKRRILATNFHGHWVKDPGMHDRMSQASPAMAGFHEFMKNAEAGRTLFFNELPVEVFRTESPGGHPQLRSVIAIPMRFGGEIVGQAAAANRSGGYDEALAAELQPFISTCAAIIHSVRIREAEMASRAALTRSEENLRAFLDGFPETAFLMDTEGRIILANATAGRRLDPLTGNIVGRIAYELIPADLAASRHPLVDKVMRTGVPVTFQDERAGFTIENFIYPAGGPGGLPERVAVIGFDVTERRKIESELRESETTFHRFMDNFPGPALIKDDRRRYVFVNRYMSEYFGAEAWIGDTAENHLPPDRVADIARDDVAALDKGSTQSTEVVTDRHGRLHTYDTHKFTIRRGEQTLLCSLSVDISDRVRAEQEIIENLAEKETLLREIYHRTKNNMQVIRSMLMLQASAHPEASARDFVKAVEPKIKAMALVHQMLYQSKDLSQIDLAVYLGDLARLMFQGLHQEPERIRLSLDLQSVPALIDTALPLGLVFNELLSNALRHAFPGDRAGEIRVGLRRDPEGRIELGVADDGVGPAAGFDPRTQPGFGLKLIFGLIEQQLGGTIEVQARPGLAYTIGLTEKGEISEDHE